MATVTVGSVLKISSGGVGGGESLDDGEVLELELIGAIRAGCISDSGGSDGGGPLDDGQGLLVVGAIPTVGSDSRISFLPRAMETARRVRETYLGSSGGVLGDGEVLEIEIVGAIRAGFISDTSSGGRDGGGPLEEGQGFLVLGAIPTAGRDGRNSFLRRAMETAIRVRETYLGSGGRSLDDGEVLESYKELIPER